MTAYLVIDASGAAVSSGTVIADPLPAGLTAIALTDAEWADVQAGLVVWDATAAALAPVPFTADPHADLIGALKADAQAATTIAKLKAVVIAALDAGEL